MAQNPNANLNTPLNVPALEALESMTGYVPDDVRAQILAAHFTDDLGGLRDIGRQLTDRDEWEDVKQPKAEITDYVESYGIPVPRRFATLDDAMLEVRQGRRVIVRSEHPREYDSFSGLLKSYHLNQTELDNPASWNEVAKRVNEGLAEEDVLHYAKWDNLDHYPTKRYLQLASVTRSDFYEELGYSFWEYVSGTNVTVTADDTIEGRYHITGLGVGTQKSLTGGIYASDGQTFSDDMPKEFDLDDEPFDRSKRAELIDLYEIVRRLPKFSARNCPTMELQVDETGSIYFLQYHKGRPFRAYTESLDPKDYLYKDGWLKAEAVRGALGSFVTLGTGLWYPTGANRYKLPGYTPIYPEDASMDLHDDIGFSEFVSGTRTAYVSMRSAQMTYLNMADGAHELRSRWFKPHAALAIGKANFDLLMPRSQRDELVDAIYQRRVMGRFIIDYASDGLTGYMRVNPDSEQPVIKNEL